MNISIREKYVPYFIYELHRHQQYQVLAENVQNWDDEKISQENIKSNLLSLFQYRMFTDPGFYQHVFEAIQNDEIIIQNTIRYLKYLWYSWTVDPLSYLQELPASNTEFEERLDEICDKLCTGCENSLAQYLYKYPLHSVLDYSFILELRNLLKKENRDFWELSFLQLTRNCGPYSDVGIIAYLVTKGQKDLKLWKKLELEWLKYFNNEITFEKNLYPRYSNFVDDDEVLASNEEFEKSERYFFSPARNKEPEASLFFSKTNYCLDLRNRIAKEFHIDNKPYWEFIPPKFEDYRSSEECYFEEFRANLIQESRPFVIYQKFTTDFMSIAAEFWFLSKTEPEMLSLLNQEWEFSTEKMLVSFADLPLSVIGDHGTSYLDYGCADEALAIFEYYLTCAKTPEEHYHGHMNIAECHRLHKQYDDASSHYLQAKEIVAPFLGTMNWHGLDKEFQSPEAYGRLAEIHIREMNYLKKKKELKINPKKILKTSLMAFNEKDRLANNIFKIYRRVGLGRKGSKLSDEWHAYSLNDSINELNLPKEKAESLRKEQIEFEEMWRQVNATIEYNEMDPIWEDRDRRKEQYQDFAKICENAFQISLRSKYCEKLENLQKFYPNDITVIRQMKLNSNAETIYRSEQEFCLQSIYEYAESLYKIGNYRLCSDLARDYLRFCKEIHYWDVELAVTDNELNRDVEQLFHSKPKEKKINSNVDLHAELVRWENSPFKQVKEYQEDCAAFGLWGISAYAGCSLIMEGKLEEGMQRFSDELELLSSLQHEWELSLRFGHFIGIIIENAYCFGLEVRKNLFEYLENATIEQSPGYPGVYLISDNYLSHYWLPEAEIWFKGKKHDHNIKQLSLDDKGRMYQIKGRFYLKRGSMGAEKMLRKAEESPIMSKPGQEMMSLQRDLANLALLKKDFSGMKKCYVKILESGYEPNNETLKKKMESIQNYLDRHLTLDKLSSPKLEEVVRYFEKAELESIQFYNLEDSDSSKDKKVDCSDPLSHYAWGLDKYLYLVLWTKVRDDVFREITSESEYNDLQYSKEISRNSWYPPFERISGKSTEKSPTLGNWKNLSKVLDTEAPNQVILHMSNYFDKLDPELKENITKIAGFLHTYRNDICHAKPVYLKPNEFQEKRLNIVGLLNELFDSMADLKL